MVFSVFSGGIEKKERKCLSVALCKKIWTLLLESGILGFGICITIEIRNPSSIEKESVIQYLESRYPESKILAGSTSAVRWGLGGVRAHFQNCGL